MTLTGGCYCGQLRYRAEGEPSFKGQCFCRECRCSASCGGASFCGRCCRPGSLLRLARWNDRAEPASWMYLDSDQRGELFQLQRRLLPGRLPGQQYRLHRIAALKGATSAECRGKSVDCIREGTGFRFRVSVILDWSLLVFSIPRRA